MNTTITLSNPEIFKKIRALSNRLRFKIIELSSKEEKSITKLGKELHLSYKRCSDYCAKLEGQDLIQKRKDGKEVFVKSKFDLKKFQSCISN
jgi:predicted transcriptional regulator